MGNSKQEIDKEKILASGSKESAVFKKWTWDSS